MSGGGIAEILADSSWFRTRPEAAEAEAEDRGVVMRRDGAHGSTSTCKFPRRDYLHLKILRYYPEERPAVKDRDRNKPVGPDDHRSIEWPQTKEGVYLAEINGYYLEIAPVPNRPRQDRRWSLCIDGQPVGSDYRSPAEARDDASELCESRGAGAVGHGLLAMAACAVAGLTWWLL